MAEDVPNARISETHTGSSGFLFASMNTAPQSIPVKMSVGVMFHRGLLSMWSINYPAFRCQI